MTPKSNLVIGVIAALVVAGAWHLEASPVEFVEGLPNMWTLAEEVAYEIAQADATMLGRAFWAMLETIQMAFIGTMVGYALAFPMSLLASRNLTSRWVYVPMRGILAMVRTLPSILWALLFVIMVGPGPFAGILALTMYTLGFVAKMQYESMEVVDADPMDAASAIGLSKLQMIRYVVIPESASQLLGQLLYMFDYNVRQTSILGLVGAGGIGFYIMTHIKFVQYGKAAFFMLVVLITVLIIDWASLKLRDRYVIKSQRGVMMEE